MHPRIWLTTFALSCALSVGGAVATATAEPIKREILALYDGAQEGGPAVTRIHRFAELPLNHLGFILRYRDIRTELPAPAEIGRYRGVLTWFAGSVLDGGTYLAWAAQVARTNIRYVILGDVGAAATPVNLPAINRILAPAGARHTGDFIGPTLGTRVARADPDLVEFECRLDPVLPDFPIIMTNGAATRVGLALETPSYTGGRTAALVTIGDRGGYAAFNYEFCHQRPPLYQGRWLINPFTFFAAAFGSARQPVPDTTTASGNRLYLSMLDSEGWSWASKVEGVGDGQAMAGEVVLRELITPFPDLPATVSLRVGETPRRGRSARQASEVLHSLLAAPNVALLRRPLQVSLSRFDAEYPSISNLAPLVGAGPDHVVNEPLSDETAYGHQGTVGENGFAALKQTLANTEAPRRLKPFDLNYRAYAGEYAARLRAVRDRLLEARSTALTPISANDYIAIVDGFFSARIDRLAPATWQISQRGKLQTIRFDDAEQGEVDMTSSVGVIGQTRAGTSLYVALDEASEPAVVVLGQASPPGAAVHPGFSLVQSRWLVRDVASRDCALRFQAQGFGSGSFSWIAAAGRYAVQVDQGGKEIWRHVAEADATGRLDFVVPADATNPVTVTVSCIAPNSTSEPERVHGE